MVVSHAVHHQSGQPIGMRHNFLQFKMASQGRKSIKGMK